MSSIMLESRCARHTKSEGPDAAAAARLFGDPFSAASPSSGAAPVPLPHLPAPLNGLVVIGVAPSRAPSARRKRRS